MKKLFFLFFSLFINLSVFSEIVIVDGVEYEIVKKAQKASVHKSGVSWKGGNVVIPSTILYNDTIYDVVAIDDYAFDVNGMSEVPYGNITLPNTIKTIGYSAFSHSKIDTLRIPDLSFYCKIKFDQNYGLGNIAVNPLAYTKHLFVNGVEIRDLIIPNDVDSISAYAFWNAKPIISVTIPKSVKSIGKEAFRYCKSIGSVQVQGATVISESAFGSCNNLIVLSFNDKTELKSSAFSGCNMLESIIGDSNITKMGQAVFSGCINLKNFTLSNEIEKIETRLFYSCSSLTSITIPTSCTLVGANAFEGCSDLSSVTIPDSVTIIGERAFSACTNLVEVVVGTGITKIESCAFSNCSELKDVFVYSKNVPQTNNDVFDDSYIEYATLHVRESAVSLYKESTPWNTFKEIVKIDIPKYTITYFVDGEVYKSYKIEEDITVTPESTPTKEGYTFSGWSEIPETMPAHDVTVTGSFTVNKYKLNYKVDGEAYKTYDVEFGATITPEVEPTKEGYTFSGWSIMPETMPAHDVTVTGTFSKGQFQLTYKVDDQIYKTIYYDYNDDITPEPEPTKEGYTFSGWSEIPETMPAHDVTVTGSFTIVDPVTITAKSYSRKYGEENPNFEYTSEGATLIGTPGITCDATVMSTVGEYPIIISKGTVTNYNDHYINGVLTITKAPLTITAKSYTIKQGDEMPTFEAEYSGFKNNETNSVLTTQPTITTTATSAGEPGTYDIVVSGASATNYEISYVKGMLTIEAVEITPITETEETSISEQITADTDLENAVIDNTYYNVKAANGDGYNATEQALVLNSTTTSEQMTAIQNAEVGDAAIRENYSGVIFEIPAGQGTVTVDTKTIGTHVLNVQIGNGEPNKITKSERGTADVSYDVSASAYVYLYASTSGGSETRLNRGGTASANSVLLYGYKVTIGGTGINAIRMEAENGKVFDLNGHHVKTPGKGVYIINGQKVVIK